MRYCKTFGALAAFDLPMKRIAFLLTLGLAAVLPAFADQDPAAAVYELRIYTTNEGKLPDLLARFRDHTCRIFERVGIKNIGYWVPVDEENGASNTLIYVIEHASRDAATASWKAFGADPEWQEARKASEANGKLLANPPVSIFMQPTDFSPVLKIDAANPERTFELRTYTTPEGKLPALHSRFRDHTMALFTKHGMTNMIYWAPTDADKGAGTKLIYLLAHASKEAGLASFGAFRQDPDWIAAKAESEKDGSLTVPGPEGVKSIYMKPTDFSPLK